MHVLENSILSFQAANNEVGGNPNNCFIIFITSFLNYFNN